MKKKTKKIDPFAPMNKYEEWLMKAIETDEFRPVPRKEFEETKKRLQEATRAYLEREKKEKKVTIRMKERDLAKIQSIALENGLPYQTLINTLLHQYASGKINIQI